jgi:hypothetical protein
VPASVARNSQPARNSTAPFAPPSAASTRTFRSKFAFVVSRRAPASSSARQEFLAQHAGDAGLEWLSPARELAKLDLVAAAPHDHRPGAQIFRHLDRPQLHDGRPGRRRGAGRRRRKHIEARRIRLRLGENLAAGGQQEADPRGKKDRQVGKTGMHRNSAGPADH